MPSSPHGSISPPKPAPAVVLRSSQSVAGWRGVSMIEGSDNGGMVYNQSHNGHLVFVLLGGEVETWWNDGGVGRWRRALPGALSVGGPGRAPNRSWINPRHYAFATVQPEYLRSVVSGEALRRLTEMSTHYCLHEYYPRAAEGVELVKALNRLMYEAASEVGLHVEELSLGLVRWLEGVAGCPPAVDPMDGLNRVQLRRVAERVDAGLDKPLSLRELADLAGGSPFHFCKMFKRTTGVSPWQFVIRWRIDRAAQMLLEQRHATLSTVAMACGCVDQSHLTRVFKRLRGTTPGAFARRYKSA